MSRERWFRGDHEGQEPPFDWYGLARAHGIAVEQAQSLYEEAVRRARAGRGERRSARDIYLALIDDARLAAWQPAPGKVTRTMRLQADAAGKKRRKSHISPLTGQAIAPGKRTLTSYLEPPVRGRRGAEQASHERERLETIAGSFRAMGVSVPADLQNALARAGHSELADEARRGERAASDAAQSMAPVREPLLEHLVPGTAAHRRHEASVDALFGHFEALDALDEEEAAAGVALESQRADSEMVHAASQHRSAVLDVPTDCAFDEEVAAPMRVAGASLAPASAADPASAWHEARAQHLADRLAHLMATPQPARSDLLLLLSAMEPEVARDAVARLRDRVLPEQRQDAFAALDTITHGAAARILEDVGEPESLSIDHAVRVDAVPTGAQGTRALLVHAGQRLGRAARDRWQASALRTRAEAPVAAADAMTGGALSRLGARMRQPLDTFLDGSPLPAMAAAPARPATVSLDRTPGTRPAELDEAFVQRMLTSLASSPGEPLPAALARRMSHLLGHDFAHVRVSADARAAQAAGVLGARAFTIGARIYFGREQWAPGSEAFERLLAHELTHVVQHDMGRLPPAPGGRFRVSAPEDSTEREAERSAARVHTQGPDEDTAPAAEEPRTQSATHSIAGPGEPGAAAGGVVSRWPSLSDVLPIATIVRRFSPGLADLIDEGPVGVIRGVIEAGLETVLAPVTDLLGSIDGTIDSLTDSFTEAFQFIQGLFAGDPGCCQAFVDGIDRIRGLARSIAENPAVQALQDGLGQVSGAIEQIAVLVLSPVFDGVKELLGGAWEGITDLADTISGWLEPILDFSQDAWSWVMDQLGIGGEGEGGILSWLTDVAGEAWSAISETLAPIAGPLQTVGGVLLALSPVGPLMAVVMYGPELVEAVQWLWQNRDNPDIVQQAHAEMGNTILPGLLSAAQGFGGAVASAANWLVEQATSLSAGLLELLGAVTGVPLLGMARGAVQALSQGAAQLARWATGALSTAVEGLQGGFAALQAFVEPYAEVLCSVGLALTNPAMIPVILAGHAWLALPDCIKAPIIDLLLDAAIVVLEASPSLFVFGPLWAILKNGVIGFLRGLREQPTEVKEQVSNKIARILSGSSPAFLLGFAKGFLQGVWEGLTDPFVLIWSAIQGLGSVVSWLGGLARQAVGQQGGDVAAAGAESAAGGSGASTPADLSQGSTAQGGGSQAGLPSRDELGARAGEMMGELQPPVEQVTSGFMPAVQEAFQGGEGMTLEGLIAKLREAWGAIEQTIQGAGASLAGRVCEFFMGDEAEGQLGESVGWLAGTIAFEVVLGILTAGAWQPVSAAGRALQAFARILDWTGEAMGMAFRLLGRIGGLLLDALRGLGRMLANAGGAARQVLDALSQIGSKLMAFADELLARFGRGVGGEAAEEAGERAAREGAEDVVEEAGERAAREGTQEAGERAGREGAEEAGERGAHEETKEAVEEAAEEPGERASREATEEAGEEGAEQGGKRGDGPPPDAEKQRVGAEARLQVEALDGAGFPSTVIVRALKATFQPRYRWIKDFVRESFGGARFRIFLIASKIPVGDVTDDGAGDNTSMAAEQHAKSVAGSAASKEIDKYMFEPSEVETVKAAVTQQARMAAEKAYNDAISSSKPIKQARRDANKAANEAAQQAATQAAQSSARDAAERAIRSGTAFDMTKLDQSAANQLGNFKSMSSQASRLGPALSSKSEQEFVDFMQEEVRNRLATVNTVNISGPPPQAMSVYEYPDGTVVRFKPQGDRYRLNTPTYSIEVKKDPSLPDLGPDDAAFKVDANGRAIPKNPYEVVNPYEKSTKSVQHDAFNKALMDAGHRSMN